jgi:hypothetical protein
VYPDGRALELRRRLQKKKAMAPSRSKIPKVMPTPRPIRVAFEFEEGRVCGSFVDVAVGVVLLLFALALMVLAAPPILGITIVYVFASEVAEGASALAVA